MTVPRTFRHHDRRQSGADASGSSTKVITSDTTREGAAGAVKVRSTLQPISIPSRPVDSATYDAPQVSQGRNSVGSSASSHTDPEKSDIRFRNTRHRKPASSDCTNTRRQLVADGAHQPDTMPPAVAALLAVTRLSTTADHVPSGRNRRSIARRISIDDLVQEWRKDEMDAACKEAQRRESEAGGSSYGSTIMGVLLERPWESDLAKDAGDAASSSEDADDADDDGQLSICTRSLSNESVPSLDTDIRSLSSWEPPTPTTSSRRRRLSEKNHKRLTVIPSPSEQCPLDHPLLPTPPQSPAHGTKPSRGSTNISRRPRPQEKPQSSLRSFKSNLTASFSALANAARSFSNFAAPSIPPDDLLSRGILFPSAPPYRSEMRPKPLPDLPAPALRRYLNPTPVRAHTASSAELTAQLHEAMLHQHSPSNNLLRQSPTSRRYRDPHDDGSNSSSKVPMIQLQTYADRRAGPAGRAAANHRRNSSSALSSPFRPVENRLTSPLPSSDTSRASGGSIVRQREPRENSDFLRVIVLEMSMRRSGKLDARAPGKARIWLPPRESMVIPVQTAVAAAAVGPAEMSGSGSIGTQRVPRRWAGVSAAATS